MWTRTDFQTRCSDCIPAIVSGSTFTWTHVYLHIQKVYLTHTDTLMYVCTEHTHTAHFCLQAFTNIRNQLCIVATLQAKCYVNALPLLNKNLYFTIRHITFDLTAKPVQIFNSKKNKYTETAGIYLLISSELQHHKHATIQNTFYMILAMFGLEPYRF